MKEYDKALETYEKGLEHEPGSAELQEGIARCMQAIDKARAPYPTLHLRRAWSVSPAARRCRRALRATCVSRRPHESPSAAAPPRPPLPRGLAGAARGARHAAEAAAGARRSPAGS